MADQTDSNPQTALSSCPNNQSHQEEGFKQKTHCPKMTTKENKDSGAKDSNDMENIQENADINAAENPATSENPKRPESAKKKKSKKQKKKVAAGSLDHRQDQEVSADSTREKHNDVPSPRDSRGRNQRRGGKHHNQPHYYPQMSSYMEDQYMQQQWTNGRNYMPHPSEIPPYSMYNNEFYGQEMENCHPGYHQGNQGRKPHYTQRQGWEITEQRGYNQGRMYSDLKRQVNRNYDGGHSEENWRHNRETYSGGYQEDYVDYHGMGRRGQVYSPRGAQHRGQSRREMRTAQNQHANDGRPSPNRKKVSKGPNDKEGTPKAVVEHRGESSKMFHYSARGGDRQEGGNYNDGTDGEEHNKKATPGKGRKRYTSPKKQYKATFESYWSKEDVQRGLKRGELIEGPIRINPRNYEDAYVPHPDGVSDVYIPRMIPRNRALNCDVVAVLLNPRHEWRVMDDYIEQASDLTKKMSSLKLGVCAEGDKTHIPADSDKCDTECSPQDRPDLIGKTLFESSITKDCVKSVVTEDIATQPTTPTKCTKDKKNVSASDNNIGMSPSTPGKRSNHRKSNMTTLRDLVKPVDFKSCDEANKAAQSEKTEGETEVEDDRLAAVPDKMLLRTGKVVYIIEQKHSRAAAGKIKPMQDGNPNMVFFSPSDSRLPRLKISMKDCPADFKDRPEDYNNHLFIAQITEWPENSMMAYGQLKRSLGEAGEIEPETAAMLMENDVDDTEFSDAVIECLPKNLPWRIPAEEITVRKDLRKECIFTIDPATARDLDDALHVKSIGNVRRLTLDVRICHLPSKQETFTLCWYNAPPVSQTVGQHCIDSLFEVGVHIADVSYFVDFANDLDDAASRRATSVYLIQKVIPMLPRLLCEELCSLNPDVDRLTFSVIWKMTKDGEIMDEWFGRSIICSCAKLSYQHAQGFIEDPEKEWTSDELPPISEGFTISQIKEKVLQLNEIAKEMRKKRFDNGALRLDKIKLEYTLDKETGLPSGYGVYKQKESNKLVEEFMLLANMAVAHKIYKSFPEDATLRRHPPPQSRMVDELHEVCQTLGIALDTSSAGSIQRSIVAFSGNDIDTRAKLLILTNMCAKPMQNALYFCTGSVDDEEKYRHYALNVPLYTHFTSPIRRYPDLMVHRMLAASLGYSQRPEQSKEVIQRRCDYCNDKKTAAKRVSDASSDMFFSIFVKECGPLEEDGMVMSVLDQSFDVLILALGVVKRVYCEKLPLATFHHTKTQKLHELSLTWKTDENHQEVKQTITVFTKVKCVLKADEQPLKWIAIVKHPDEGTW